MSDPPQPLDLTSLQGAFAFVDRLTRPRPAGLPAGVTEFLLLKKEQLKVKMYQERGHMRPHFHIDYGPERHVASYAIDTGERLEGTLARKYDAAVRSWAATSRDTLLAVWDAIQAGRSEHPYVQSLPAMK